MLRCHIKQKIVFLISSITIFNIGYSQNNNITQIPKKPTSSIISPEQKHHSDKPSPPILSLFITGAISQIDQLAKQIVKQQITQQTQWHISDTLSEFPEQIADTRKDKKLASSLKRHITNINTFAKVAGSDTLYLNSPSDYAINTLDQLIKPTILYDHFFNFNSLIEPITYNNAQLNSATKYIDYLAQTYLPIVQNIHLKALKRKLINTSPKKRAELLQQFINNPEYQHYQLAIRSMLAAQSILLGNLNTLLEERRPFNLKALAKATGISNKSPLIKELKKHMSLLAIQNHMANRRINNPQWFKDIQSSSMTDLLKRQVVILAEIQSSLQRQHIESERMLATLSILTLTNMRNQKVLNKMNIIKLNQFIDQLKTK